MLHYKLYIVVFSCCIVLNSQAGTGLTDSIEYHIEHSDYKKALQLIHQHKNLKQADQTKLELYEVEIMLALGNITDAGLILHRVKNSSSTSIAKENPLYLRYILLKSCLLKHQGKADSAFLILWDSRSAWAINENRYPGEMAEIYGELGKYYSSIDEYGPSIKYFNKALNLIASDYYPKSATYNASLARLYWLTNQKDSSNKAFDQAQLIIKNIPFINPDILESYFLLTIYYFQIKNDVELAETCLSKALIILQVYPKDHYMYGRYYFYKRLLAYDRQDFLNSFQFAKQFESIVLKYPVLKYYQKQNLSTLVAILYWYIKDYKQSIFYCHKALQTTPKESNVYFYYIIGLSSQKLKNYSEAKYYFHKIIAKSLSYSSPGDMNICGYTYLELAKNAQSELKYEEALEYLTQGLKFYHKNPSSDLGSSIYLKLAEVYFYMFNNIEKAIDNVQLSIVHGCKSFTTKDYLTNPSFDDILFRYKLIEPFSLKAYLLYMLYQKDSTKLGLLKASLECQDMAVKLYEKNLLDISEENAGLNMADLKVTALNNAVSYATLLYLKTNDFTYADKAFQYAEKSKMQLLLIKSMKNQTMHLAGISDSIIEKEEKLNHLIVEAENSISLSKTMDKDPAAYEAGLEKVTRLHDQRDLFIHQLQIKYPAYYQAKYNYQVAGIREIQKILDEDQVIIEYQLLNTELITFIITSKDFNIHYQLINKKVPAEIQKLRELISVNPISGNSAEVLSEFIHSSEYLYSVLISPVYDQIKNKRLIIIPHNALTQIPFEILIKQPLENKKQTGFRNLNYLIKEFSIIYAYSGNLLLDKESHKKNSGKGTGIFLSDFNAETAFNDSIRFPELKGAESEAQAVKKLSRGKIFKGRKSTESAFKTNAGKFLVLHIASHTLLDAVNPFLSCVLLTPKDTTEDGLLYAWEIGQMKLNAQLVVLSGCNSGYGVLKKNEGLISLARSFLYTGVRTIAFTLWPAADQAGSAISTNFYKGIKKRHTLDVAMQAAKLNFIAEADPVKAHPYFWASYIIVGHDDPIPLGSRVPVWLKIAVGLFGVVILALTYRKVTS